jgi:hypothetical protein
MPSAHAISFTLALLTALVACTDDRIEAPPACVGERRVMVPDAELCGATSTGFVLFIERGAGDLVLSRLGEHGSLAELTRITSAGGVCGFVAHAPGDPAIWVVQRAAAWIADLPDQLHRIELDGALTWSAPLEHEGALIRVAGLTTHAGQQFVGGSLVDYERDANERVLVLQRRNQDQVAWTQTGYQGLSPDSDAAAWPQDGLRGLVASDAGLTFMAHKTWTDSSTVSLFTVDPQDGQPSGAALLTKDDFSGPYFDLSSDQGQRVYVSEQRAAQYEYAVGTSEVIGIEVPAQSIITAYANGHSVQWRAETDWLGLSELRTSPVIPAGGWLYHLISGDDRIAGTTARVHVARYTEDGELDCEQELHELRGWSVGPLGDAGEGRLVAGVWERVSEDPEQFEDAIVVLELASED